MASEMATNMSNNESTMDCRMYPTQFLQEQFYLVAIGGTFLAGTSLGENSLVLLIFFTNKYFWKKHYYYLMVLGIFDVLQSIAYIAVLSVCVFFEYTHNLFLMRLWYGYVVAGSAIWNIARATSTYLLVAASMERFLSAMWLTVHCKRTHRVTAIIGAILCAILITGSQFWEFEVLHRPNCTGLAEYFLNASSLLQDPDYSYIWAFLLRNITTVFLPFTLLLFLNCGIVLRVQGPRRYIVGHVTSSCGSKKRERVRKSPQFNRNGGAAAAGQVVDWVTRSRNRVKLAATKTLVVMIVAYLMSSGLAVFLAAWEYFSPASLFAQYKFYTFASDLTSICSILVCASRLPVYFGCDVKFREAFLKTFCLKKPPSPFEEESTPIKTPTVRDPKSKCWKPRSFGSVVLATMRRNSRGIYVMVHRPSKRPSKASEADTIAEEVHLDELKTKLLHENAPEALETKRDHKTNEVTSSRWNRFVVPVILHETAE